MENLKGQDHEGLQSVAPYDGLHVLQAGQRQHPTEHEKELYAMAAPPNQYAERHQESARILGLRRPTFWLLVSNVVLAIALIIVGVVPAQVNNRKVEAGSGVSGTAQAPAGGCSASNTTNNASSTSSSASSSTTARPAEPTPLSQPDSNSPKVCFSTTTPLAPGADPAVPPGIECPISAGQVNYTVPGTGLTFRKMCGTDFGGNDMGSFPVRGMNDCLALCAQLNLFPASVGGKCVGVTWVYGDGPQGTGFNFCFPKNDTSKASQRAGTESATLLS